MSKKGCYTNTMEESKVYNSCESKKHQEDSCFSDKIKSQEDFDLCDEEDSEESEYYSDCTSKHHFTEDTSCKCDECFLEGIEEGYSEGNEDGYREGYEEGCKDGYEKAKEEVIFYIIKKRKSCKKRCRCKCFCRCIRCCRRK